MEDCENGCVKKQDLPANDASEKSLINEQSHIWHAWPEKKEVSTEQELLCEKINVLQISDEYPGLSKTVSESTNFVQSDDKINVPNGVIKKKKSSKHQGNTKNIHNVPANATQNNENTNEPVNKNEITPIKSVKAKSPPSSNQNSRETSDQSLNISDIHVVRSNQVKTPSNISTKENLDQNIPESQKKDKFVKKRKKKKTKSGDRERHIEDKNSPPRQITAVHNIMKNQDENIKKETPEENEILERLKEDFIYPLKKRSLKFVYAKFFCRLCEYHCDNEEICFKHINEQRHARLMKIRANDVFLKNLPQPTSSHTQALTILLEKVYTEQALSENSVKSRYDLVKQLADIIKMHLPEAKLVVYGSTRSGFALKDSDLNISLQLNDSESTDANLIIMTEKIFLGKCCLLHKGQFYSKGHAQSSSQYRDIQITKSDDTSLGFSIGTKLSEDGTFVVSLIDKSPADMAGLKVGDHITKINDNDVHKVSHEVVSKIIMNSDNNLRLTVQGKSIREGCRTCILKRSSTVKEYGFLILTRDYKFGASIDKVIKGSPAFNAGLRKGDVIVEVNDINVELKSHDDIKQLIATTPRLVKFSVYNNNDKPTKVDMEEIDIKNDKCSESDPPIKISHVLPDLYSTIPTVTVDFVSPIKITCKFTIGHAHACETSSLLQRYMSVDDCVKKLGVLFRYWAKICLIDDPSKGTLPSYTFFVMVVYFLQNIATPILLPCKRGEENKKDSLGYEKISPKSLGELWFELLQFYSIKFDVANDIVSILDPKATKQDKRWQNKKFAVEDPFLTKYNIARSISHTQVFEFIYDRLRASFLYFGVPQTNRGPIFTEDQLDQHLIRNKLNALFTNAENNDETENTPQKKEITENNHNISKSVERRRQHSERSDSGCHPKHSDCDEIDCNSVMKSDKITENDDPDVIIEGYESDYSSEKEDESGVEVAPESDVDSPTDVDTSYKASSIKNEMQSSLQEQIIALIKAAKNYKMSFLFNKKTLCDPKGPPIVCAFCQKKGHLKGECPDEMSSDVEDVPEVSAVCKKELHKVLHNIKRSHEMTQTEIDGRMDIVSRLEGWIQKHFGNSTLQIFGSSCNGFGFANSDLDICMTLESTENLNHEEAVNIIKKLAKILWRVNVLDNILPITSAKVPIVKFKHRVANIECDISLQNTLALHNTNLLKTFASIDPRATVLGYAIKYFAKICDVCDASKGTLSSYAYILMVIHYLQHTNPPVLPVLQELYMTKEKPKVMVDGCNTWFYGDLNTLPTVWKGCGHNRESVADLWLGFFIYYTELFQFKNHVITIKQFKPLSKLEKMWNGKCLAVEDPFDLGHNLGNGLSCKMNTFIMKVFRRARSHFHKFPYKSVNKDSLKDLLFNPVVLVVNDMPNDHVCFRCSRIGHKVQDCPLLLNKKNRRQSNNGEVNMVRGRGKVEPEGQFHGRMNDYQSLVGGGLMYQNNSVEMRMNDKSIPLHMESFITPVKKYHTLKHDAVEDILKNQSHQSLPIHLLNLSPRPATDTNNQSENSPNDSPNNRKILKARRKIYLEQCKT